MSQADAANGEPAEDREPRVAVPPSDEERALAEAVRAALAGGAARAEVAGALRDGGCPAQAAETIVRAIPTEGRARRATASSQAPNAALAQHYARRILTGFLWATGGVVVTLVSYDAAGSGGRYLLAYGAIIYGVIAMMSGAAGWAKHR